MKQAKILVLVGGILIFAFSTLLYAGVPQMINYQGKLTTPEGALIDDTLSMVFTVYDAATDGGALWTETQTAVIVEKGIFTVLLGSVNPIPDTVFTGAVRYLGVKVEADPEMTPRKEIVSVGYAYRSAVADSAINAGGGGVDSDWTFRITDTADTTLMMGGEWGIARAGNVLYGNADSTHVNLGVACTTGTSGQNLRHCTVGGGGANIASGWGTTVGGGEGGTANANYSTVGGGVGNTASGSESTVGGGQVNTASAQSATVGGGGGNTASGSESTVGGGQGNTASGSGATVGGGLYSAASGTDATVGGGRWNTASGKDATVGGGDRNMASGLSSTVPGGCADTAAGDFSLAAGDSVRITSDGDYTFAFGRNFTTSTPNAVIFHNSVNPIKMGIGTTAPDEELHVVGNIKMVDGNQAAGKVLTSDANGIGTWQAAGGIGGSGTANYVTKFTASTTLGNSAIYETSSYVGIGTASPEFKLSLNNDGGIIAKGVFATGATLATSGAGTRFIWYPRKAAVRGGYVSANEWNDANIGYYSAAFGQSNKASGNYSNVSGGSDNLATNSYTTVSGGGHNTASGWISTIGGGQYNTATRDQATVGGGHTNTASGLRATVGGGLQNTASGTDATVPGGYADTAAGDYSFASGYKVNITSDGDYTFAFGRDFTTSTPNAVIFHNSVTPIKVGVGTTAPDEELHVVGNIKMVDGNQAAGKVLTSDASGVGTWQASAGGIGGSGTANYVPKFTATTTLGNSAIYETGSRIGIGTTTPDAGSKLHVQHNNLYAGYFTSNYLDLNTHVIHSEFTGSGNYDAVAVYGKSKPADWYGYGGHFEGGKTGVLSLVFPTGLASYYGVDAGVFGGSGTNFGIYGQASGTGTNYGVYGYAHGGTTNWSGYFYGNVNITGSISKGSGSFKIDHPLDPENKYLFHSFVESPDMMNVYNGNVILGANGEATVELPAYFEALNRDFRYQLTCIGGFAPVYIAQKISGNQFSIAGGEPGMEVSWQVTGIRHDKFAEANRIQVEVDKPEDERGKYLHPQAYNLGEEYDIHYEQHKRMREKEEQRKLD